MLVFTDSDTFIDEGHDLIHCSSYSSPECYDGKLNTNLNYNSLWNEYTPRSTSTNSPNIIKNAYIDNGANLFDYTLEYNRLFDAGSTTDTLITPGDNLNIFLWAWFGKGREYTFQR